MKAPVGESSSRTLCPEGTHLAICYQMIEIGTIKDQYMGQEKEAHKVRISWELPHETFEHDGKQKPVVISKEYTFFMGDRANLRKDLEGWRGKKFTDEEAADFDIEVLLGKPCQLSIVHKTSASGKVRDEVASVVAIVKGMTIPPQTNPNFVLSFEKWDEQKFNSLPTFLQDKIKGSKQYLSMLNQAAAGEKLDALATPVDGETFAEKEEFDMEAFTEQTDDDLPF